MVMMLCILVILLSGSAMEWVRGLRGLEDTLGRPLKHTYFRKQLTDYIDSGQG